MGKPTICIGENKDADQLRGNREADQRLCFRYSDSTLVSCLSRVVLTYFCCLSKCTKLHQLLNLNFAKYEFDLTGCVEYVHLINTKMKIRT